VTRFDCCPSKPPNPLLERRQGWAGRCLLGWRLRRAVAGTRPSRWGRSSRQRPGRCWARAFAQAPARAWRRGPTAAGHRRLGENRSTAITPEPAPAAPAGGAVRGVELREWPAPRPPLNSARSNRGWAEQFPLVSRRRQPGCLGCSGARRPSLTLSSNTDPPKRLVVVARALEPRLEGGRCWPSA